MRKAFFTLVIGSILILYSNLLWSGTVTVDSPNGGENWVVGSKYNITWTSSGFLLWPKLEYSKSGGESWIEIHGSLAGVNSPFEWTVPNTVSSNCLIRISGNVGLDSVSDISDSFFSIVPAPEAPTVTTGNVSSVTLTSAVCGGNVTSNGNATIIARGSCWNTSPNPTTADSKTTNGTGTGAFTSSLSELSPGTTYYVRAYATNSVGTAYGAEKSFTTPTSTTPTVTTNTVSSVTSSSATCGGNVTSDGNATVTARGVCWNTSPNPTTTDSKTANGSGTGAFTSNLSGLNPGTAYYVRAYATNSAGTAYGAERSFSTPTANTPTVTTNTVSSITSSSATCGGNVTSEGDATVTARGVCWSKSANPTTGNSKTSNGTGTGSFKSKISGLKANTRYYIRAYAVNSNGTSYGMQRRFKTSAQAPTYTLTVQASLDSVPVTVTPKDKNNLGDGNAPFFRTYNGGTVVALTAPATHNTKEFLKWFVDGDEYTSHQIQVTMNDNRTVQAVYQSETYLLSVLSSPPGVNISVSPKDNHGNGEGKTSFNRAYNSGVVVTLSAPTSFSGGTFIKWEVNGKESWEPTVQVTMEGNQTAAAYYETSQSPEVAVNRTSLNLGYVIGTAYQPGDSITVFNSADGAISWTASSEFTRVSVNPASGTDYGRVDVSVDPERLSPGKFSGSVDILAPLVSDEPIKVTINLWIKSKQNWAAPFGEFATPGDGAEVSGSIPFTGWALADTGIQKVTIHREDGNALVYIGDAVLVEGARLDIETDYPDHPMNYKAGWGYMMLSNFLPNGGNGTFRIHAIAIGNAGKKTTLGVRNIIVDNAHAEKPFGTIETPGQGETISGSNYANWGWVLTPPPNNISTDGSTIDVYVDSVYLGHPTYNIFREDIADLFSNYLNSHGAFGFITINTTTFRNGTHQIWWIAKDNAGNADGIGSRFFNIINSGTSRVLNTNSPNVGEKFPPYIFPKIPPEQIKALPLNESEPMNVFRGYNRNLVPERIFPLQDGITELTIHETERVELHLESTQPPFLISSSPGSIYGYLVVGEQLRKLPVGSTLDRQKGIFYWILGLGFVGNYDLVFVKKESTGEMWKKKIRLTIAPKFSNRVN